VAFPLAVFLLVAAFLKTYDLSLGYWHGNWSPRAAGLFVAAIAAEVFVGVCLLTRRVAWGGWISAVLLFAVFAGLSLNFALRGLPCPCFGRLLVVNAWVTLSIDLAAVVALLVCRPVVIAIPQQGKGRIGHRVRLCFYVLACSATILMLALVALLGFGELGDALANLWDVSQIAHSGGLIVRPATFDFGTVTQRGEADGFVELVNQTESAVEIGSTLSSCHCLAVNPTHCVLQPSQTRQLHIHLDLTKQPEYVGSLNITLQGRTQDGTPVFWAEIRAQVKPR
jgi:hypothetical protein